MVPKANPTATTRISSQPSLGSLPIGSSRGISHITLNRKTALITPVNAFFGFGLGIEAIARPSGVPMRMLIISTRISSKAARSNPKVYRSGNCHMIKNAYARKKPMNAAVNITIKVFIKAMISQQKTLLYRVIYGGIKILQ